jgi:CRISPR/Cas system CMR-associated protein Cmr1 (group 7 of RAMP superfamily)
MCCCPISSITSCSQHKRGRHWRSQDEIGHLVTAFNGMLGQLDHDRVIQQERAASALPAIKSLGVMLSIDDFGTAIPAWPT